VLTLGRVIAVAVLLTASGVGAQEVETAAAPTAPVVAPPDANAWWLRYREARKKMEDGEFKVAADEFDALAASAPDPVTATFVREDARVCRGWATKNLVLAAQADIAESAAHSRSRNERTTDELAVLYTNAVFYGIGTGAWLAVQTKPESAAGGVLPALGLSGLSVLGVYGLDSGKPLGYGVPQSIVTGMYIGLYEGIAWTVWNQSRFSRSESWRGESVATVIWGSASVGALAGGLIGTYRGTTPGRASFVGSAALWAGAFTGLMTAALVPENDSRDDRSWLGVALGLNAGALGGALAAGEVSPSIARVRFLDLGGIGGFLLAAGLYLAAEGDSLSSFGVASSVGIASGLGIAWAATRNMPRDAEPSGAAAPSMALAPMRGGAQLTVAMPF
jgi:hypothetical protein